MDGSQGMVNADRNHRMLVVDLAGLLVFGQRLHKSLQLPHNEFAGTNPQTEQFDEQKSRLRVLFDDFPAEAIEAIRLCFSKTDQGVERSNDHFKKMNAAISYYRPSLPPADFLRARDELDSLYRGVLIKIPDNSTERHERSSEILSAAAKNSATGQRDKGNRPRKSEETNNAVFISSLTDHHEYADGGVLNYNPILYKELKDKYNLSAGVAKRRFERLFGSHEQYCIECSDKRLNQTLERLNDEQVVKTVAENAQIE